MIVFNIPSVVDVDIEVDDIKHIGKTTAKIKAIAMKHPRIDRRIEQHDVQHGHGHVAHADLKFHDIMVLSYRRGLTVCCYCHFLNRVS